MAILNLWSNILGLAFCFIIGYLSDKVEIYKVMTAINIIILGTWFMLWHDIKNNKISTMYNLGYIISMCSSHASTLLGNVLLGKICSENTRGTMFGFNGFFGSVGIAVYRALVDICII